MPEWDKKNRPKGYIISVTPGFASMGQGQERLINMGLARKLVKAARLGFEFAEIDFEALSEMFEPEIQKQVNTVKKSQDLEVGLHLPVSMDLCLAPSYYWKQQHEQLVKGSAASAEKLKAKFALFHTSSRQRPAVISELGPREMPSKLAAYNGRNLGEFIVSLDGRNKKPEKRTFQNWFMGKFIHVLFRAMGAPPDPTVVTYYDRKVVQEGKGFREATEDAEEGWVEILNQHEEAIRAGIETRVREQARRAVEEELRRGGRAIAEIERSIQDPRTNIQNREQAKEVVIESRFRDLMASRYSQPLQDIHTSEIARKAIYEVLQGKEVPESYFDDLFDKYNSMFEVYIRTQRFDFYEIYDYWTRHGSEGEESAAYHVIAKWMYNNNDDLWDSIVDTNMDPDQIVFEAEVEEEREHDKEKLVKWAKQFVTAVAAKYIEGHLTTSGHEIGVPVNSKNNYTERTDKKFEKMMSVLEYLKYHKVHIFIETNMPGDYGGGQGAPPGELRIIKATDHVKICRAIDPENISYCMDFEHLLTNYVDPLEEAKELKKRQDGKYIRCLHINAPRPIKGAHAPIRPLSHDMYIIYSYIKTLKEAGVKNAYWIWEMGSYGVEKSAVAFHRMREQVMKDTKPQDLPPEFFGIDKDFEARQMNTIKDHFTDPLEGLLHEPEEAHTFLSSAAVEKGKGAEYQRERYQ